MQRNKIFNIPHTSYKVKKDNKIIFGQSQGVILLPI